MFRKIRGSKKGFTLAELLIVVAIVAVLVAIAFPVFISSLEEARAQTEAANARSTNAMALAEHLSNPTVTTYSFTADDGKTYIWEYTAGTSQASVTVTGNPVTDNSPYTFNVVGSSN